MKSVSKLSRIIFVSPWSLLLFFIIPLLVILGVRFHIRLPLANSIYPLLLNNAFFSLVAGLRLLYYLRRLFQPIRYGAVVDASAKAAATVLPCGELRESLVSAGYVFDAAGSYGEKRDAGFLGTVVLYGGLFVALAVGTLDNVRQFSGTVLHSVGVPVDLSKVEKYRRVATGPLTDLSRLPKMKFVKQLLPDAKYPRGATETAFLLPDGTEEKRILAPSEPYRVGPFDIHMIKMLYEPEIVVTLDRSYPVFSGKVMLKPLPEQVDGFGFYAPINEKNLEGEIYYQPEKSRLKVILRQGTDTLMDRELIFQTDRQQTWGNITLMCQRMGVWSEIHVVYRRHMPLILLCAFGALIGLIMRLTIRPQRVWLEEAPEGCGIRMKGGLKVEGLRVEA